MYAPKPTPRLRPPARPQRRRPPRAAQPLRQRRGNHRGMAYEASARLAVNVVMSLVAVSALVHLLPYRSSQEVRLQELHVAVKSTDQRVQRVQSNFGFFFDPSQARSVMEQQSNRIDPQRRQVIWQQPNQKAVKPVTSAAPAPEEGD